MAMPPVYFPPEVDEAEYLFRLRELVLLIYKTATETKKQQALDRRRERRE